MLARSIDHPKYATQTIFLFPTLILVKDGDKILTSLLSQDGILSQGSDTINSINQSSMAKREKKEKKERKKK